MGSASPEREASRRHERSDRSDRDRGRDRDRPRESDRDRTKGKDRDSGRRRDRHRDGHNDDRRSRHGESHRRDRDDREGRSRDAKEQRERPDRRDEGRDEGRDERRDERRDRKDDEHRRSRPRSHDSKKRRRDDSEDRSERAERRRRDDRKDDRKDDRRDDKREEREARKEKKPANLGGPLPDQAAEFAMAEGGEPPPPPKEKPNWSSTGALAAESNAVSQADGSVIVLKYSEPPNARKPSPRDEWKMFVFKDGTIVDTVDLNQRSCWLLGREDKVVDLVAAHPSISGQHAVVQFRHVEKRNEFGDRIGRAKPYIIDLASANGTQLNGEALATQRFVELRDKDMVKLGHSAREYVFMLAPKD